AQTRIEVQLPIIDIQCEISTGNALLIDARWCQIEPSRKCEFTETETTPSQGSHPCQIRPKTRVVQQSSKVDMLKTSSADNVARYRFERLRSPDQVSYSLRQV